MTECNLQHYKKEETFCYPPWCSVCERGPQRRRSISETNEPCRRKSKELKTLIPKKYNRSQEYENMEFEYECKGQWQEKDMRYEFTRIRSNLCELPTSYISNNCQVSSNVTNPKISNELSSFDCMKTFNVYESPIKFTKVNDQIENLGDMQGKPRIQKKQDSKCSLRGGNSYVKSPLLDQFHSRSELMSNYTMTRVRPEPNNSTCSEFCSLSDFKLHNIPGLKPVCFETSTYFNKNDDVLNISERHAREMNRLREQLMSLRSAPFSQIGNLNESETSSSANKSILRNSNILVSKVILPNQKSLENKVVLINESRSKLLKKLSDETDPPVKVNKSKISLKTRAKVNSAKLKLKTKPKAVSTISTSSNLTESDECGSDSENETNLDEVDNVSEPSSTDESNKDPSEPTLSIGPPETGSGDSIYWMLRPSLFPNIPPYIRFNAHDYEGDVKFPYTKKFLKWKLSTITPLIVRKTLQNSGFVLVRKSNTWLGTWGKHMKSPLFKTLRETQKLNHFPGTFQLGRKDRLWRNFQRMMLKFGVKEFGFLPHTYILPQEMKLLKQCWEYKINSAGTSDMWIIKPPASARGVGIKVINKLSQIPKKSSLVVQKYISNPFLINGSKFDLRLYVLVTSFHPLIIYLYPEGLARFASAKYSADVKDLKDRYMHLTNYSINKLSSQYTANEDFNSCEGHKWTITKLLEVLQNQNVDTKILWKSLQQLVIKTILACESPVVQLCEENMLSRYNCYELFGIDVLLDEKLKPWLLEVNISPSLHSASPLDAHVKGPIVHTLFNMAQFHLPPRMKLHMEGEAPDVLDARVYSTTLNKREQRKHSHFEQLESRNEYLDDILKSLTGDDIRHLTRYEDELSVKGKFERIFPCQQSYKYLQFMEPRYYNRLFDAWETKYGQHREEGITVLQHLCDQKLHLKVPLLNKNLPNTIPSDMNPPPSKMEAGLPIDKIKIQTTIENQTSLAV
ncbi:unnamed protein product [Psylliodes chrysocephalus]|uniref:Tubulin polyglutamylase TTLL4 n=1 Tax=Psylliodes chrysocephalus TaxID=3402493 RepID=A0A9P0CTY2_9CUCU|nr:unnamed protein product [Psylliodes chrysocephala]